MGKAAVGLRQLGIMKKLAKSAISILDLQKLTDLVGKKNFQRTLYSLEKRGLVSLSGETVTLSKKGKKLLDNFESDDVFIKAMENWDGVWRVVIYDVPNELNNERRFFRLKLKQLGFVLVQKSVWIFPYECKEEIAVLAHSYHLSPFVMVLIADKLPNEGKYLKIFNLTKEKNLKS